MGKLGHQICEPKLLNKHAIRQVGQIRQCDRRAREIRLLGQHALVTLQGEFQLSEQGLDASLVGLTVTLAHLEDLFVCDAGDKGVEVGLFDGEGLPHQSLIQSFFSTRFPGNGPTC